MSRWIRAITATIASFVLAFLFALVIFLAGVPYKFLIDSWLGRWVRNPFSYSIEWYARIVTYLAIRGLLKIRIDVHGASPKGLGHRTIIVIANHPSSLILPFFFAVVTTTFPQRVLIGEKSELRWNPIFGTPLWIMNSVLFVLRSDRERSFERTKKMAETLHRVPTIIVLFLDTHRPKEKAIHQDQKIFAKKMPLGVSPFEHTCFPHDGTLWTLLQALPRDTPVFDYTVAMSKRDEGTADAAKLIGETAEIWCTDVTEEIPRGDRQTLQRWLTAESYTLKNQRIARLRKKD